MKPRNFMIEEESDNDYKKYFTTGDDKSNPNAIFSYTGTLTMTSDGIDVSGEVAALARFNLPELPVKFNKIGEKFKMAGKTLTSLKNFPNQCKDIDVGSSPRLHSLKTDGPILFNTLSADAGEILDINGLQIAPGSSNCTIKLSRNYRLKSLDGYTGKIHTVRMVNCVGFTDDLKKYDNIDNIVINIKKSATFSDTSVTPPVLKSMFQTTPVLKLILFQTITTPKITIEKCDDPEVQKIINKYSDTGMDNILELIMALRSLSDNYKKIATI